MVWADRAVPPKTHRPRRAAVERRNMKSAEDDMMERLRSLE